VPLRPIALSGALAALAAAILGCGGSTTTVVSTTTIRETPDSVPKLPKPWRAPRARGQGLAFGVPPEWVVGGPCLGDANKKKGKTGKTAHAVVICSPNRLTTVSITADRSQKAMALTPEAFAQRTVQALDRRRYGGTLHTEAPQPYGHHYDAASIDGRGHLKGRNFPSKVKVVVLRRDGLVNITAVIATNAERAAGMQSRLAERIVRTIRDQPSGRSG
jgi:hypothetical protein